MSEPIWTNNWAVNHHANWRRFLGKFKDVPANGLEIGSMEGRSACFFVHNILTHPESKLTCVDPFLMCPEERFWQNVHALGCYSKIELYADKSDNVDLAKTPWDFVYVDGLHTAQAVLKDAVRSWVALKKGGIMIFDDVLWNHDNRPNLDRPKIAIDYFLHIFERELKILHLSHQCIVEKTV